MDTEREKELYNSLFLDAYVKLINEKYPDIRIDDLMEYAGIENYELGDYSVWFTQTQINRFHERLSMLTDNLKIAREAGRFVADPKCFGEIRGFVISIGGISRAFGMIGKYAKRLNRSTTYTTRKMGRNRIEITVTPNPGVNEEKFQCQNRLGVFRGLADLFYHTDISISHPECIFDGGQNCRYVISWKDTAYIILSRLSWLSGFVGVAGFIGSITMESGIIPDLAWISFLVLFLGLGWAAQVAKSTMLRRSLQRIHETREDLLNQIEINAENSRVIIDIGQALGIEAPDAEIFDRIAEITGRRLKYDRVMILTANEDETHLNYRGGYGFTHQESDFISGYNVSLDDPSEGVFYESFKQDRAILVNDLKKLKVKSTPRSFHLAELIKPFSFITCPISVDGAPIGIIVAGNVVTPKRLGRNDKHLVMGVAQQIGSVYRRQRFEAQQAEFNSQIIQLQKMEALGVLAGGIAHDFNNILSPILGYTDMCINISPKDGDIARYLQRVKKASVRAQDLVGQILAFSRQGEQEYIRLQPGPIIKETLKLLRATMPTFIKIENQVLQGLKPIMADPTQIHQLVMNLCTNAYHAMGEKGGVLRVSLSSVCVDSGPLVENRFLKSGDYILIQVSDTGHGMSDSLMEKIFEPYFTTKEKGKGTGLGLSIAHSIVTRLKGHITVSSTLGEGTCFDIYLPQINEDAIHTDMDLESPIRRGNESILVVDDEPQILILLKEMLTNLGYKVTAYSDSTGAFESFKKNPGAYDLVITDMGMPGMTGADLSREIMKINPEMPVVMCTGYSDIINEEKAKSMGIKSFVMKPVVNTSLAECLRSVLENHVN